MTSSKWFHFTLALAAAFTLSACGNDSREIASTYDSSARLTWGGEDFGGAPYTYRDPKDPDKRIGFEVDIMEELGKRLNREVEFIPNDWDTLLVALNRGDFDVAMSGVEITPERSKEVAFSNPYYISTQQLVVRAADTNVKTLDDLQGKTVGTLVQTTSEKLLREQYPDVEIKTYADVMRPYDELEAGRVDGVLMDLAIAVHHAKSNESLRFAGESFAPGKYAMAIRQNQPELKDDINEALSSMRADGTLQRILEKWKLWNAPQESSATAVTAE